MTNSKKGKLITGNAIRTLVFVCVIALVVLICSYFFGFADAEHTNVVLEEFYEQEENTIDCIYFGPSVTQRAFVTPEAFHDYGVAEYTIASGTQPFVLTRYLIEETLKTQQPKLFIVELKNLCKGSERLTDAGVRRILDNMKMSKTKSDAIQAVTDYAEHGDNKVDNTGLSYYLPILKYHSRWNPSLQPKYSKNIYYFKGYTLDTGVCFGAKAIDTIEYDSDHIVPIAEENQQLLDDFLDYCDTLPQDVLFVISPYEETTEGMGKFNYMINEVESRGYEVLNFLPEEKRKELGLEDDSCYYNKEHLNFEGSLKFTKYMSEYIKANYGIEDRRGDSRYDSWETSYDDLINTIKTVKGHETYLEMLRTAK